MATKKDISQAQAFSRRRLLTAFVSGAPGGRELEPTKPLRAVIGGVALSVLLVLGSMGARLIAPGLPDGWDRNKLVVAKDTGSRYVAVKGTLYPVLNTTSARLLLPADSFAVVDVDSTKIATTPRGATVGILGAPDALPAADTLRASGWTSCLAAGRTVTALPAGTPAARATEAAVLAWTEDGTYLVVGTRKYQVPSQGSVAVVRALGMDAVEPLRPPGTWVGLFPDGSTLTPLRIAGAGTPIDTNISTGEATVVGTVVTVTDAPGGSATYLIDAKGDLVPLSPFALALYRIGDGARVRSAIEVTQAQVALTPTADAAAGPTDWPTDLPVAMDAGAAACALLEAGSADGRTAAFTRLAQAGDPASLATAPAAAVSAGTGALVRAVGDSAVERGPVKVIDAAARAYGITEVSDDVLARLGYTAADVRPVPQEWTALFEAGPNLSPADAGLETVQGEQ